MKISPRHPSRAWYRAASVAFVAGAYVITLAGPAFAAPEEPAGPEAPATLSTMKLASRASAQDAAAGSSAPSFFQKVEVSGLVDAYYTYNFNEPATASFTPLRNFDVAHNQFSLALLELAFDKPASEEERVGFRFDLQYGQVGEIFNTDPVDNSALFVQQAYVSYLAPVGGGLTFDFGKFVTPIGTEPTESHLNNNYSRSFLYALGPYYHVGARVGYAFTDKVTFGAMLVNGWNSAGDANSGKSFGASVTVAPTERVTFIQNVLVGPEQADSDDVRTMSDTNLAVTLSDTLTTGLNYAYVRDKVAGDGVSWQGVALYLRKQVTPAFAVAPRFEVFKDDAGLVSGAVQNLKEFTLTGEIKHSDGLILRLEYRRDWSDIDFFEKNGTPKDNQNTFTFGFVYAFSSKS